jgi:hypothetical protein
MDNTSILAHDRIMGMMPWLHQVAKTHSVTLERIDALAINEGHRQALLTQYRVRIELAEKEILALYDTMMDTAKACQAVKEEAEKEAAILHLVEHANQRGIHGN